MNEFNFSNVTFEKIEKLLKSFFFYGEKGSLDEIAKDILKRLELKELKTKLQKITIILDDKSLSKENKKKTEANFNKIQKRIQELNN